MEFSLFELMKRVIFIFMKNFCSVYRKVINMRILEFINIKKLKFDSAVPFIVIFLFYINLMIIIRFKNLIKLNLI